MEKIYEDPEIGHVRFVKGRGCRRIGIKVHLTRGVVVTVPFLQRYEDALRFFQEKRGWVISALGRQREKALEAEMDGKAVVSVGDGTVVHTLMSEIVFSRDIGVPDGKVMVTPVSLENVRHTGRTFLSLSLPVYRKTVSYPDTMPPEGSPELTGTLLPVLVEILRKESRTLLPQKLSFLAGRYGFSYNRVSVKHNSTNWGSCSTRGNINLNLNLVRLPEPVCDYVLLHELCHLRHPDHGPAFHALLEQLCSDNFRRYCSVVEEHMATPAGRGFSGDGIEELRKAMSVSRAQFPVHHVLEREIKKYRLV